MKTTHLTRQEIIVKLDAWLTAWNNHHLGGVMEWLHEDIIFENWDGNTIKGRDLLYKAWKLWFNDDGNFNFVKDEIIVDEPEQKFLFAWTLTWSARESGYEGRREIRKGLDVIHLKNGKILSKLTYTKTDLIIDNKKVLLQVCNNHT